MPPPPPFPWTQRSAFATTDQIFLSYVLAHGAGTRAEIARESTISKPTISDAATRLVSAGLIREAGEEKPGGRGRRAMVYEVNPEYGHASAIVFERRHLVVKALDFSGGLQWERQLAEDVPFAQGIIWAKAQIKAAADDLKSPCLSAAISVAAPVDPYTGAVQPMAGAPLGGFVPNIISDLGLSHVPRVRVDNDVNWAASAEATDPEKAPNRTFLYIYLGAGVGGALVSEGRVIRGANGAAGEVSFLRTPKGNTLHAELSSLSFGSPDHSFIDIEAALAEFATPESSVAAYAAALLAHSIMSAATITDPGTVILSGPLSTAEPLIQRIEAVIERDHIAPVDVMRGCPDDSLLLTGVSRSALHAAWDNALEKAGTLADS